MRTTTSSHDHASRPASAGRVARSSRGPAARPAPGSLERFRLFWNREFQNKFGSDSSCLLEAQAASHTCPGPGFIDENAACEIEARLQSSPPRLPPCDVRPILLAGVNGSPALKEAPQRIAGDDDFTLVSQLCKQFMQRQIGPPDKARS